MTYTSLEAHIQPDHHKGIDRAQYVNNEENSEYDICESNGVDVRVIKNRTNFIDSYYDSLPTGLTKAEGFYVLLSYSTANSKSQWPIQLNSMVNARNE